MRILSIEPTFSGSTVKVRISNAYLKLKFTELFNSLFTIFITNKMNLFNVTHNGHRLKYILRRVTATKLYGICFFCHLCYSCLYRTQLHTLQKIKTSFLEELKQRQSVFPVAFCLYPRKPLI